jgi:hypothetical protein
MTTFHFALAAPNEREVLRPIRFALRHPPRARNGFFFAISYRYTINLLDWSTLNFSKGGMRFA